MNVTLTGPQLEKLCQAFGALSSTKPQTRPELDQSCDVQQLVMYKGHLTVLTTTQTLTVDIPPEEVVDDTTYVQNLPGFVSMMVGLVGLYEYETRLNQVMKEHGIILNFHGNGASIEFLEPRMGELDHPNIDG